MSEIINRIKGVDTPAVQPLELQRQAARAGDGSFRKLHSSERAELRDHLLRLTADDRCMRFCAVVSDQHIQQYCMTTDERYRLVLGYFFDGVMRGAGEIVFLSNPTWRGSCEIALSVEQPYQNCGIGSELLRRLLVLARNRGAASVFMLCVRENRKMQALADKFKAELKFQGSEVTGTLYPRWPTSASLMEETWADGFAVLSLAFGFGHLSPTGAETDAPL